MAAFTSNGVWKRTTGMDEISANVFNLFATITTVYGLGVFALLSALTLHTKLSGWEYLGLFIVSLVGAVISCAENVGFSYFGLSIMASSLGAICGPFVGHYKLASVADVALGTIVVTLMLGFAGSIYPKSLENWGSLLFFALGGLILVQFTEIFFAMFGVASHGVHTLIDWLGVILFSGYIVYDFNRAQYVQKTPANAVRVGVAIFLDIVNLFIRLLELFGVSND